MLFSTIDTHFDFLGSAARNIAGLVRTLRHHHSVQGQQLQQVLLTVLLHASIAALLVVKSVRLGMPVQLLPACKLAHQPQRSFPNPKSLTLSYCYYPHAVQSLIDAVLRLMIHTPLMLAPPGAFIASCHTSDRSPLKFCVVVLHTDSSGRT